MTEKMVKAVRPRVDALMAQDRNLLKALVNEALDKHPAGGDQRFPGREAGRTKRRSGRPGRTDWRREQDIALRFIQPGKPDQNAYIERFNRTYREEVLSAYLFDSLDEVRKITADWLERYNEIRPHDALRSLPPTRYHKQLNAAETPV